MDTFGLTPEEFEEATDDMNVYYTAEKLGRKPTLQECIIHYLQNRVPPWLKQIYPQEPKRSD